MKELKGYITGKYFILVLLLAVSASLYGNPLARIFTYDDPLYYQLERISIESGIAPPSSASPWSGHELFQHLEKIDKSKLSQNGRDIYDDIYRGLVGTNEDSIYHAAGTVAPEVYVNVHNMDEDGPSDWVRHHNKRPAIGTLEAEAILGEHFYGLFSVEVVNQLTDAYPDEGEQNLNIAHISTNFVFDGGKIDHSIPHTAFAGYSTENTAFSIGRNTQSWGRGKSGNLFIGDHALYHDYLTFSAFHGPIAYRFAAMQFNSLDDDEGSAKKTSFSDTIRLFIAHRADLRFHPRLLVSLTEGVMFYAEHMDLRMFSPLMYLHNYYNFREAKNSIQIDVEYLITPGVHAYSQLFIDQYQTSGEIAGYDECNLFPNAFGALLGIQFHNPTEKGYLSGYAESVFTSTYLYLRRNISNNNECDEETRFYTDHYNLDYVQAFTSMDKSQGVSFLGYRYGPDAFFNTLHLSYEQLHTYRIFGELIFGIRGEQGLEDENKEQVADTGKEYVYQLLPSGIKEYTLIAGVGGELNLQSFPAKLFSQVHGINKWNYRNTKHEYFFDIQLAAGLQVSFNIM